MTDPSWRELEHRADKLGGGSADVGGADVTVAWRDADPEQRPEGMSWDPENGTLTYDAWRAQRDALEELASGEHDLVALLGGYGSGKTIDGARWLLANAIEFDGSHFLAMGQSFSEARSSTFQILFEQLPGERTALRTSAFNGPENSPIVADYNRAEHRLTLVNDSVITLGSADKWSRFAGAEFGGIWMDEPSHYGNDLHDLLEMMGSRLRGVDGPKTMFWTLTGNGFNSAWEILEKRQDANGDPIGLNIEVIRASTLENPYLDPADKERFERQYGGTGREEQALLGGFAAAQGLVYSRFSRDTHVIDHADALERVDDAWRVYGYDYGWSAPRVLLEIGKTSYDQLVALDEYHERETHVEDAIAWLEENGKPKAPIYCDHDPEDIEEFNQAGYPAKRAAKNIDEGIAEVRKRLESDGALPVGSSPNGSGSDTDVDGRVGLLISENCSNLIRELLGYKEEHVGTSQAVDHVADSLRYACMGSGASGDRPKKKVVRHRNDVDPGEKRGRRTIKRPKRGSQ